MNANKLSLNSGKTEYMIIGSPKSIMKVDNDPLISLFNNSIQRVKVTKSIGLMIDEALAWIEQVNLIASKVNKSLNAFKRLRTFVDLKILKLVYKTLIQPYFDYCSQVCGCLGITLCNKLQRLQNRAVRILLNVDANLDLPIY